MKATVYFPPSSLQRDAWFASAAPAVIEAYRARQSIKGPTVEVEDALRVDAAPDELFDLSNNPGRQDERAEKWGRFRSLSVGDIVEVEGRAFLCKSIGWEAI